MEQITRSLNSEIAQEGNILRGVGAVFYNGEQGSEYNLYGNVWERVSPSAFRSSLERQGEVLSTFNHDTGKPLGRTPNTLKLWIDERGLNYEIDLPNTTLGNDIKEMIRRKDIRGSSFIAGIKKAVWSEEGTKRIRTLTELDLIEVGPVTLPCYGATSGKLQLRGQELEQVQKEEMDWIAKLETERRIAKAKKLLDELTI